MVKRGQAVVEDIIPVVKRLLPILKKAVKIKFHVKICAGLVCELWRRDPKTKPNTMMIGVDAINFFWVEYGKSLEKTIQNILVHEAIHIRGLEHNAQGYKLGFYSDPNRDTWTPQIEKLIFK